MKEIEKLRELLSREIGEAEPYFKGVAICDEIEAEIERDYMPKPKIEKNFNAINSGITDISEALQNIAECNAAKCAMRQEVTHADVETMIGSIAAIADAYYMRLPVDADGVPIHVGDEIQFRNDSPITVDSIGTSRVYKSDWGFFGSNGGFYGQGTMKNVHHVKPDSFKELLDDVSKGVICYPRERVTKYLEDNHSIGEAVMLDVRDRLRELLGGDAE